MKRLLNFDAACYLRGPHIDACVPNIKQLLHVQFFEIRNNQLDCSEIAITKFIRSLTTCYCIFKIK